MPNPTTDAAERETLLTPDQLAARWQLSRLTLEAWRGRKAGPPWIKLGPGRMGGVRYKLADVEAWEQANRQEVRP